MSGRVLHLVRIMAIASLGAIALASCASAPAGIIGLDGGAVSAAEVPGATEVNVFVATTRAPSDDAALYFSGERSEELAFARVTVSIPPSHVVGEIERPKRLPPDPRTEFVILDPQPIASGPTFAATIDRDLARKPSGERNILLFVHGYNTDFPSAVLRTAQFAHDSGFTGTPVLFTWASRGRTLDYVYDINSALHARDALLETGAALRLTGADRLDILAHSMGNLLTVESIRQQAIEGRLNSTGRIHSVILAAPDIDLDLFRRQLKPLRPGNPPIYVLVLDDDEALAVSTRLAGNVRRVGDATPDELTPLGLEVIDLSAVKDRESIHHTKFADAPGVVQMIGSSILAGVHPAEPQPSLGGLQGLLRPAP